MIDQDDDEEYVVDYIDYDKDYDGGDKDNQYDRHSLIIKVL